MESKEMKCNRCKVILPIIKFSKNRAEKYLKSCDECRGKQKIAREKNKCEHGRQQHQCKECGGSQICEHQRIRNTCKDCMNDEEKIEYIQKTKEYYEENRERILQRLNEYREKNRDKINEKRKEKITCPCGSVINKQHIRIHERSQKHQQWEKNRE